MEGMLGWFGTGALIGAASAQKKGGNMAVYIIGGALLGPIAIILLLGGNAPVRPVRKCPFCAEVVQPEAVVCKHCHRDLPIVESAPAPGPGVT